MRTSPRHAAVAVALALAAAATLGLASVGTSAAGAAPAGALALPTPTPQPDYSKTTCTVTTTTQTQPGAFLSGESVAITRSAKATCGVIPYPVHIVLVLDASASMAGEPNEALRNAMVSFVEGIASNHPNNMRLGVVSFAQAGRQLCALTDQFDRVLACIRRVRAQGEGDMGAGLRLVSRTLDAGLGLWPTLPPDNIREVVILVSNGNAGSCSRAQRERGKLMDQGILLISVCAGRDCDVQCIRSLASSPRYYFLARSIEQLVDVFRPTSHSASFGAVFPTRFAVTETLVAGARLIESTVHPTATIIPGQPTRIMWTTTQPPLEGFTVTYRVQPRAPGYLSLSDGMRGTFRDSRNLDGAFAFAQPWARVLSPPEPADP